MRTSSDTRGPLNEAATAPLESISIERFCWLAWMAGLLWTSGHISIKRHSLAIKRGLESIKRASYNRLRCNVHLINTCVHSG